MTFYKLLIDLSDVNQETKQLYIHKIQSINDNLNYNSDSGFDLFCCKDENINCKSSSNKIDLKVKCKMLNPQGYPTGFYLCPRSSLGKTGIRLSNSLGIIYSRYRGHLLSYVDNISNNNYKIQKNQICFQLLAPTLLPIKIEIVNSLD